MICYLDRTYCVSKDCTNKCGRKLTPEIIKAANAWWESFTGEKDSGRIAMSTFCGDEINMELWNGK